MSDYLNQSYEHYKYTDACEKELRICLNYPNKASPYPTQYIKTFDLSGNQDIIQFKCLSLFLGKPKL